MKLQHLFKASTASAVVGMAFASQGAMAQEATGEVVQDGTPIIVTGSRIERPNIESNSPIAVVSGEETVENADITLDTFLNTLPQVNPAGTTTSNNPGNGGQSNVNLRGLGSNRNLVLIDGRRPMVSSIFQDVDLNTIPQGLIERIEIVTGGAGAIYGADAIAGVVNIRMKDDFEGIDARYSYANTAQTDAEEWSVSGVIGGNFADGRGNIAVAVEHSEREGLIKSQREFSRNATSTTRTFPTGRLVEGANPIPQAAIDALFATYGVAAGDGPTSGLSNIAFNNDGSLFGTGIFNSPEDVTNYRYPPGSGANENVPFFPDFYSYNFDIINLLVLPLERDSVFGRAHYEVSDAVEVFAQGSWTQYSSASALAPTPVSTGVNNPATQTSVRNAVSPLVEPGQRAVAFVVPVTNPFISPDLAALLAARVFDPVTGTGNNTTLIGNGATEPFTVSKRFLDAGLRQQDFNTEVMQGLLGVRGELFEGWRYEIYASKGNTEIISELQGNINVTDVQMLLEAPDGGASICAGGFNPFGVQPLSQECLDFVREDAFTTTEFSQEIFNGYIQGDLAELPAGTLSIVLGAERRKFRYEYDAGTLNGPIAGFNTGTDDLGTNSFTDFFGEVLIPLVRDGFVNSAELSLQARHSKSDFNDIQNDIDGESVGSWAYGATFSVEPVDSVRLRASYQHSVRAPNFGELFSGGSSFPSYFDPCSAGTNFITNGGPGAQALCTATGAPAGYSQTPGSQVFIGITGNPGLLPEESDTFTVGGVFEAMGFSGSIDYYNIKIDDSIIPPDPNIIIASCFGFLGQNPDLDPDSVFCSGSATGAGIFRSPDITFISVPAELGGDGTGYFQAVNQGTIKTSGIDFQLGYNLPTEFVGPESNLQFNLLVNYLIDFKVEELPGIVIDYADTVSYFGAGLGTSFPRWKGTLNTRFAFDENLSLDTRVRYIDGMQNRAAVQFAGEEFDSVGSVIYVDAAIQAEVMDMFTFRVGVNNLFDRGPELYSPNVQSGTDPSLYDVIGRRFYVQVGLKL